MKKYSQEKQQEIQNLKYVPIGRAKDLTGQHFGRLTVLGRAPHNYRGAYWWCICDCEQHPIKKVNASHLVAGNVQSCGCLNKEIVSKIGKNAKQDLIGQTFNFLTVLADSGKRAHNRGIIWICQCQCGNKIEVRGDQLKSNHTTSCGCRATSLGEEKIATILKNLNIQYEKEKVFLDLHFNDNLKSHPRFDFYLPNQKVIIEFDGKQHFTEVYGIFNQVALKERNNRDLIKDNYCVEHGIKIIRVPYYDINSLNETYFLERGIIKNA